jgi:hypothetical protein
MLLFLLIPKFPTVDRLWSILAETRRVRRRFEHDKLNYSKFYGITTEVELNKQLISLRLRERLVERKINKLILK